MIFLLGLVCYFWFDYKNNLLAIGWDTIIPLNPISNLKYLYTWTDINNGIVIISSLHFIFLLYALLEKLHLSLTYSQFIHTYLIHVIGALGMYYLSNVTFKKHPKKIIIALLSAVLYMFTPAFFNMYFAYSSFAFIPLILALFMDGLRRKNNLFFALAIGVIFAGGNIPDPHPRPFFITFAPIFLYMCFELLMTKKYKHILIFFITVVIYIFIINIWYFLGFFMTAFQNSNVISTINNITYTSGGKLPDEGYSTIDKMFRLFNDGLNITHSLEYLSNWFITLINYFYPVIVFSSIFFLKNKSKDIISKVVFF